MHRRAAVGVGALAAVALVGPIAACATLLGLDDVGYAPADGGIVDGMAESAATDALPESATDASDAGPVPTQLFLFGGLTQPGDTTAAVVVGTLMPDGSIASWTQGEALPEAVSFSVGGASSTAVFAAGGSAGSGAFLSAVFGAIVDGGPLGPWVMVSNLTSPIFRHSGVSTGGSFYVIGGGTYSGLTADVQYALEGIDGRLGGFNPTTPLPAALDQHASAAGGGFVFVTGGVLQGDGGISGDVLSAPQNADGTLGAWSTEAGQATTPGALARFRHGAATYKGNLLVVGGLNDTGFLSDVQVAPIAADGSVGPFSPTVSFPAAGRQDFGCIVVGDTLYVLGGDSGNDGGMPYDDDVWYAKLDGMGNITQWKQGPPLPTGLAYFGIAAH